MSAVHAAGMFDELIGHVERVGVRRSASEDEREQLVVAKRARAEPFELFARPIVWCDVFHRRYTQLLCFVPACVRVCGVAFLFVAGCADPPSKEMDQAQGAIDAARAAGADQYATTEYTAATTALENAQGAVAAGDYRLALNYALESREHAQNAARDTADAKARMRSELEHTLANLDVLVSQGQTRMTAAERARVSAQALRQPAARLKEATAVLQKAREAVAAGDYLGAAQALDGLNARVEQALADIEAATTAQSSRRRR